MTTQPASHRTLWPRRFLPRWLAWIFGGLFLFILAFILFFDWNWLKPMVEERASAAIGRPVTIGDLNVRIRLTSRIEMRDVAVANAEGFEEPHLASLERVAIQLRTFPLLVGRIVIPEIAVQRPTGRFETRADGQTNYAFDFGKDDDDDSDGGPAIELGRVTIEDGDIRYIDAPKKTDIRVKMQTEQAEENEEALLTADAEGRYNGEASKVRFRGGALLSFRDPETPYPVDLSGQVGPTRAKIKGTIERPLEFAGANLNLDIAGDSMNQLNALIGVPIPPTPRYTLKGDLDFNGKRIIFRKFAGTVGNSDLSGDLTVDIGGGRPKIGGDLVSKKVVLADLAGFIGAPAGKEGETQNAEQKEKAARAKANGRLLPTEPIALDQLRSVDVDVRYRGERIESQYTPLDKLTVNLQVNDGQLSLKPLAFGVGEGKIAVNIALDGRSDPARTDLAVDFDRVDLKRILRETRLFDGVGNIAGKARLKTTGNSISDMLGRGDGDMQLFMSGGSFSTLLLELVGVDITEALGFAVERGDKQAQLRCLIADVNLKQGILAPETLLLDTTDTNINVTGSVNMRDEIFDLRLDPSPKDVSILTVRGPIHVSGPMREPSIQPDAANVAGRGTAAVLLGVLLTPLAAIIPTLELGLGEDSDCQGLVSDVRRKAQERPTPSQVDKPSANQPAQ